jgi:transcriptional regulator with XRE-family HTH domain
MPNRLRELRTAHQLTLEQVAERAETSVQQILRLELGERRLTDDWMRRIATALGVHPFELLVPDTKDRHGSPQDLQDLEILRIWRLLSREERRIVATFMQSLAIAPTTAAISSPNDGKKRRA